MLLLFYYSSIFTRVSALQHGIVQSVWDEVRSPNTYVRYPAYVCGTRSKRANFSLRPRVKHLPTLVLLAIHVSECTAACAVVPFPDTLPRLRSR